MKRISIILLLSVFAFDILGIFFLLKIEQIRIRHEIVHQIKKGVSKEKLVEITVTDANRKSLNWKKNNEFSLDGILYDVVKCETVSESTVVYYCLTDTQETALFSKLNDQLRKNSEHSKNTNKPLNDFIKLLTNLYFQPYQSASPDLLSYLSLIIRERSDQYTSPFLTILSPPPKAFIG